MSFYNHLKEDVLIPLFIGACGMVLILFIVGLLGKLGIIT
jgi:hypothetical protein